ARGAERRHCFSNFARLPLILIGRLDAGWLAAFYNFKRSKIIDDADCATAIYLEPLFRKAAIADGVIAKRTDRSAFERNNDRQIVVVGCLLTVNPERLGVYVCRRLAANVLHDVNEVTHLTNQHSATFVFLVQPAGSWNVAAVDAVNHLQRIGQTEGFFQLNSQRREAAV